MIKKLSILIAAAVLILIPAAAVPVQASGDGLVITGNSAVIAYPDTITFSLAAESNDDIVDVRLHYYVNRLSYARVTAEIYMDIVPGPAVSADWAWDMRKTGGLPPGTVINYWWSIEEADGTRTETETESLKFTDDRFEWQYIEKENITLYWYEGTDEFASSLLNAATEGLVKLYENTGIDFTDPVELYIYENPDVLQDAMIFPQEWTGGVAYPLYSKIAIGIEKSRLDWGLRTIVHELTHLVTHRMTENPYISMPTWLDEGLAMYMEGPLTTTFVSYFKNAMDNDSLFTARSLVSPFSAYADQSYLSYAESYMLVEYLINEYGQEKMLELLMTIKAGTEHDDAMVQVYGFDMDEFNLLWLEYLNGTDEEPDETVSGSGAADIYSLPFAAIP